jgi:hypothetical protein
MNTLEEDYPLLTQAWTYQERPARLGTGKTARENYRKKLKLIKA